MQDWGKVEKELKFVKRQTGITPVPLLNKPQVYAHLSEVTDAYKILAGRASGQMGTITLQDIISYYESVGNFEGSLKQFLILFTAVENVYVKRKTTVKKTVTK